MAFLQYVRVGSVAEILEEPAASILRVKVSGVGGHSAYIGRQFLRPLTATHPIAKQSTNPKPHSTLTVKA
jgi:hypothetical protein